jgi:hypothetical protein
MRLTINLPRVHNDLQPVEWPTAKVNRTSDLYVAARRRGCNGSGDAIDRPAHAVSGERAGGLESSAGGIEPTAATSKSHHDLLPIT